MADAVGVELCTQLLRDEADVVILEVLRHARDERHTHGSAQQEADTANELSSRVLLKPCGVLVDDVAKNQRIEEREDLIDRRQDERKGDQTPVVAQIGIQQFHSQMS